MIEMEKALDELRAQIDAVDNQILALLNERMAVVKKVGELKNSNNAIIYRPEREKSIIDRLDTANQGLLTRGMIEAVFLEIFAASRNFELPERVAYLGPQGSFTHQAAENRFGVMSEYIPLSTIQAVFESVDTERVRFGVVPIENNRQGFVGETVDLFYDLDVKIVAEIVLPIHHTFASRCDQLKDIKYIYSKDVAFKQCKNFLREYFGKDKAELVPVDSTSKAAQMAMEVENSAAICSDVAAKIYQAPILFHNIEDSSDNQTRFLIISKNFVNKPSGDDKSTLILKLPDVVGSLAVFLQDFRDHGVNLIKIENRPERTDSNFKAWFYLDLDGHIEDEHIKTVVAKHQDKIKWLGSYVKLV